MALKLNELMLYLYERELLNRNIRLGQDSQDSPIRITYWNVEGVNQPTEEEIALWSVQYENACRIKQFDVEGSMLIQKLIQDTMAEKQYDSILSCISYIHSSNPVWKSQAEAAIAWRDELYMYFIDALTGIESGEDAPTMQKLIEDAPKIKWS